MQWQTGARPPAKQCQGNSRYLLRDADPLFSITPRANPSQSWEHFSLKRASPALLDRYVAKSMINMQWIQSADWGAKSQPGCRILATF